MFTLPLGPDRGFCKGGADLSCPALWGAGQGVGGTVV
jgi:hypothetical protein